MNWRLYSVVAGLVVVTLFSGCATAPRTGGVETEDQGEMVGGPSTVIAGARLDDVRGLALGSARSKGWTVVSATDKKVVLSRPVNAEAPQAVAAGIGSGGTPPNIEVTGLFQQAAGGVSVTLNAQLVAQGKDGKPQRTDYTESYRDNLTRSLDSLRSTWAANYQRVARAMPPVGAAGQAAAETADELKTGPSGAAADPGPAPMQSPLTAPTAWGDEAEAEAEAEPVAKAAPAPLPVPVRTPAPVAAKPAAPAKAPIPGSAATKTVAATKTPAPAPVPGKTAAATKTPAPAAGKTTAVTTPAKTVTPAKTATTAPTKAPAASPTKATTPAKPTVVSNSNNLVAMNRGAQGQVGSGERYAALRGCKVRSGQTNVFKTDGAAAYMRVYCTGDVPFVVKCTGGTCKGLE